MKPLLYILSIFFLLTSCKEDKKDQFARLVQEWQGKEIVFPQDMAFTRFVTEQVEYRIPDTEYKVLRYILKRDNFNRPVCIDRDSQLDKLNKFPQDITFQTFLLDRDNKVKVIGNPVHNLAVRDLYLKQMTGKISPGRDRIKTTAKAINSEVDFGAFSKSEEKTAVFEIENTGDNPLVILDISTTCGCTTANYDKRPAKPGERLRIEVRMTPKDTGFFDEIVTLKCNTASPVKVKIRGQVQ